MADEQWYYARGAERLGPVPVAELQNLAQSGGLLPGDLVWKAGMAQWAAASSMPGLLPTAPVATHPGGPPTPPPAPFAGHGPSPVPYAYPYADQRPIGEQAGMRWLVPVGRSGWAIAAGYLGLFSLFGGCLGPIAIIISIVAIIDIKTHPHRHGMGRAVFGLIMGVLGTAFLVVMLGIGVFAKLRSAT